MQRFGYELDYSPPSGFMKHALSAYLFGALSRGTLELALRRRNLMIPDFFSTPIERFGIDSRLRDLERTVALGYPNGDTESTPIAEQSMDPTN